MSSLSRMTVEGWRLKNVSVPSKQELNSLGDTYYVRGGGSAHGAHHGYDAKATVEASGAGDGPFEVTPDLAQVRIVHSIGFMTSSRSAVDLNWASIVDNIKSEEVRAKIASFNQNQSLPACVKITAATVISPSKGTDMKNMYHLQVQDAKKKQLHTPHMYMGSKTTGKKGTETVGYPLHLLNEEGGYVLEEPPQLTDTFRHYWYISNSMLTCSAYVQDSKQGKFVQIPKNSDAARLMWYILVTKNGAGAANPEDNLTKMTGFDDFSDNNDLTCWRFPEYIFNKVNELLSQKLKEVREKSYDMSLIRFVIQPFPEFEQVANEDMPALITIEIDIHVPLGRDATGQTSFKRSLAATEDADNL